MGQHTWVEPSLAPGVCDALVRVDLSLSVWSERPRVRMHTLFFAVLLWESSCSMQLFLLGSVHKQYPRCTRREAVLLINCCICHAAAEAQLVPSPALLMV